MSSVDAYTAGLTYEAFMCRALKLHSNDFKKGAHASFMTNLINVDHGNPMPSGLGKREPYFEKVKIYVGKALKGFLKFKLTQIERDQIMTLQSQWEQAQESSALMAIVESALDATARFR